MNFALILFLLTVATGVVWFADRLHFAKRRPAGEPEPWWIEYPKSFFPVLLVVFLLRSFLAEPFRIPSSSMRPTLVVGDYILVNKYVYGIRLPIVERKIVPIGDPRVVLEHATRFEDALDSARVPNELIVRVDEGHGYQKFDNQVDFGKRLLEFLERHLRAAAPPGAPASPTAP